MQKSLAEKTINNLEAHLLKLKQQTANAVSRTREAVDLKEGYLLEVDNLEKELDAKKQKLGKLIFDAEEAEAKLAMTEGAISKVSQEAQNDILRRQEQIEVLDVQLRDKEAKIGTLNSEISTLERIIPVIQEQVENNEEIASERKEAVIQEIIEKQKELEEITEVVEGAIVAYDNLISETIELEVKIKTDKKNQVQKKEELRAIAEDYTKRNQEMNTKEADIKVYVRRLKKKYEEAFPDRKLII